MYKLLLLHRVCRRWYFSIVGTLRITILCCCCIWLVTSLFVVFWLYSALSKLPVNFVSRFTDFIHAVFSKGIDC